VYNEIQNDVYEKKFKETIRIKEDKSNLEVKGDPSMSAFISTLDMK